MARLDEVQAGGGGVAGVFLRPWLHLASLGWHLATALRRLLYRLGLRRTHRLPVPVISIGNLAVGGTGKTPIVALLARGLRARGHRPGILSRGYGAPAADQTGLSDEGAVLRHLLGPDVPQVEDPRRDRGGRALLQQHPETDGLLLDDGFQHWQLARDLDIVLLDATRPFGHGHLLPRGRLRESPSALRRAGVVVLTRTSHVGSDRIAHLRQEIARYTQAPVVLAGTEARALVVDGVPLEPARLRGRRVFATAGIGNPDAFVSLLTDLGAEVVGRRDMRDHQAPTPTAWQAVLDASRRCEADLIVMTRKDAVKHESLPDGVGILDVETRLGEGEAALWTAVERVLPKR